MVSIFTRIDALGFLAGALVLQWYLQGVWWAFLVSALLPDLALLGYLRHTRGSRWPALIYNVVHLYAVPIVLLLVLWPYRPVFLLGWVAHIAVDRLLGFGFRSPSPPAPAP